MTKRAEIAQTTAQSIADTLFQTEAAVDHALCQIAAFTQALPPASRSAGFSAVRGQTVYERLAEAQLAQSQVRARIVEVHGLLADLKDASIMRTVAIGGGSKDTPPPPHGLQPAHLSLISTAR